MDSFHWPDAIWQNVRMYAWVKDVCHLKRSNLKCLPNSHKLSAKKKLIADIGQKWAWKNEAWRFRFQFISIETMCDVAQTPTEFMKTQLHFTKWFIRSFCYYCCCCCCCSIMRFVQTSEWKKTTSRNWNLNKKVHNAITASYLIIQKIKQHIRAKQRDVIDNSV